MSNSNTNETNIRKQLEREAICCGMKAYDVSQVSLEELKNYVSSNNKKKKIPQLKDKDKIRPNSEEPNEKYSEPISISPQPSSVSIHPFLSYDSYQHQELQSKNLKGLSKNEEIKSIINSIQKIQESAIKRFKAIHASNKLTSELFDEDERSIYDDQFKDDEDGSNKNLIIDTLITLQGGLLDKLNQRYNERESILNILNTNNPMTNMQKEFYVNRQTSLYEFTSNEKKKQIAMWKFFYGKMPPK